MNLEPSLLTSLFWFTCIARHRSISKAAIEMDVSRAALSQQLKALEAQLNVRLIHRTTRVMSLTEEGEHLYETIQPALAEIEKAVMLIGDSITEPVGQIRVNTSRVAARLLLEPHFAEFLSRYPRLKLELVMNDGFSNIVAEGLDAGIRLGESLDESMVAVAITPVLEMAIVGSPSYFERHGIPTTPMELAQHNCLAYRFTSSGSIDQWTFSPPDDDGHEVVFAPNGNAVFNDDETMLQAALQGVGLVQHIDLCVRQHIADGSLIRVLSNWCKPFPGFYLYVPSRSQLPAKTRVLREFLIEKRKQLESEKRLSAQKI